MMFDAAEGRIGMLRAVARVLRDYWRAAADADGCANVDAKSYVTADGTGTASNPHTHANLYGD
jgi:hypothetical protein